MTTDTKDAANSNGERSPDAENSSTASPQEAAAQQQAPQGSASPAEPSAEQKLAEAQAEAARLRDQLLRTAADFDNFRKRARREQEDASRQGRENLLKNLLPVFDNLERAATHAESAPDAKAVTDGLRIVLKQFTDSLERSGIKRIVAVGHPFDPTVHEAIQHLESSEHPAGVVVAEVQPGYKIGDYLLRAAMVVVSKGPPAGDPAAN